MKTISSIVASVFLFSLLANSTLKAEDTKSKEAPVQVPQISLEEKYCKNIDNPVLCSLLIEKGQLREYNLANKGKPMLASRALKLKLKNGSYKTLEDTPDKSFTFREYLNTPGYFLVSTWSNDNENYLMISDTTGKEQFMPGQPVFSPNRAKLVTASFDLSSGKNPNTIQVWRLTPGELVREMTLEPEPINWGPSDLKWLDEQTIQFTKNILTEDNNPACSLRLMQLKQTDKGWRILEL